MNFIKSIFLGIIAALASAFILEALATIFPSSEYSKNIIFEKITFLLLLSVSVEEFIKILLMQKDSAGLKSGFDIWSKCVLIGLGFSIVELFFNLYSGEIFHNFHLYLNLAAVFLIHLSTASAAGFFLAKKKEIGVFVNFSRIFLLAFFIHLFSNLSIIYNFSQISLVIILILIFIFFGLGVQGRKKSSNLPNANL